MNIHKGAFLTAGRKEQSKCNKRLIFFFFPLKLDLIKYGSQHSFLNFRAKGYTNKYIPYFISYTLWLGETKYNIVDKESKTIQSGMI